MKKPAIKKELETAVKDAVRLHGHLGPFLVIGVRMGKLAERTLEHSSDKDIKFQVTIRVPQTTPFSCTIDENVIFESKPHGVSSFLGAIERLGDQLENSSVADRVVGMSVALLCLYSHIKAVYGETLSRRTKTFLEKTTFTRK